MEKFDIVVIGSGPAGYTAAFRGADFGKSVLLIERDEVLGGVCLNRGCIPSKTLLHVGEILHKAKHAGEAGITFGEPQIDLEKLRSFKSGVVGKLNSGLASQCKSKKVTVKTGVASFVDGNTVSVGGEQFQFGSAIIASGSLPIVPGVFGSDDNVWDSTAALELKFVPGELLVVGAGYIGLELGSVYADLGAKVDVVEMLPEVLPAMDRDVVSMLERTLFQSFREVRTGTTVTGCTRDGDRLKVTFENKDGVTGKHYDAVLVATGRKSETADLNLAAAGVTTDERGLVVVNDRMQTNVGHIYAAGDVTTGPMLAHKGYRQAEVAVDNICGHSASIFDPRVIPSVMYTYPQVAACGLSEKEAKEKGIDYKSLKMPWGASGKALSMQAQSGFTKVLIDKTNERILGASIVGAHAGELISEISLAIEMGAHFSDIAMTIHPHPTLSESVKETVDKYEFLKL